MSTTQFRLSKVDSNPSRTRFNILRGAGDADIVGTISVKPSEEASLLANWSGSKPATALARAAGKSRAAFEAALLANRRPVSRASVLRGC